MKELNVFMSREYEAREVGEEMRYQLAMTEMARI